MLTTTSSYVLNCPSLPADVSWICQLLHSLTDAQWRDAFRAGGFPAPVAERFIRRMKQKIDEGLALKDS